LLAPVVERVDRSNELGRRLASFVHKLSVRVDKDLLELPCDDLDWVVFVSQLDRKNFEVDARIVEVVLDQRAQVVVRVELVLQNEGLLDFAFGDFHSLQVFDSLVILVLVDHLFELFFAHESLHARLFEFSERSSPLQRLSVESTLVVFIESSELQRLLLFKKVSLHDLNDVGLLRKAEQSVVDGVKRFLNLVKLTFPSSLNLVS